MSATVQVFPTTPGILEAWGHKGGPVTAPLPERPRRDAGRRRLLRGPVSGVRPAAVGGSRLPARALANPGSSPATTTWKPCSGHRKCSRATDSRTPTSENMRPRLREAAPTLELRGRTPSLGTSDPPEHTPPAAPAPGGLQPQGHAGSAAPTYSPPSTTCSEARAGDQMIDFVEALAYRLPAMIIADLMGVTRTERDLFKEGCGATSFASWGARTPMPT